MTDQIASFDGFTRGGYTSEEVPINDLNYTEYLGLMKTGLLNKLKEDVEEAKLRYEDDQEDASLGEYIGLKAALERLEKFIEDAPKQRYSRSGKTDRFKADLLNYYSYPQKQNFLKYMGP